VVSEQQLQAFIRSAGISTSGSKKSHSKRQRLSADAAAFLIRSGWELLGHGQSYTYLRPAERSRAKDPVVTVQIPTDCETVRLGKEWHEGGKSRTQLLGPWSVRYRRCGGVRITIKTIDFTHGQPSESVERVLPPSPAVFEFGTMSVWQSKLEWANGEENPPRLSRFDSNRVAKELDSGA